MGSSRFSDEQIICILNKHQVELGWKDPFRQHGINNATLYKWHSKYGGMEVPGAKRLKVTCSPESPRL